MKLKLSEIESRYNIIRAIVFKSDEGVLATTIKMKIIKLRVELEKIVAAMYNDRESAKNVLIAESNPDEVMAKLSGFNENQFQEPAYIELLNERDAILNKINSEMIQFSKKLYNDEVEVSEANFSLEEYENILEVNSGISVTIQNGANENKLSAPDLLQAFYQLFVREENEKN
jgi:hypothetical protein